MPFDANRDMKIEAAQGEDGLFILQTKGLAARKRAELEMHPVPEEGLRAAAAILNQLAEYTVNREEVLPDQDVGFELAVGDEDEPLLLVVRTVHVEGPKRGFVQKLLGSGKGTLRVVDSGFRPKGAPSAGASPDRDTPREAIATMLVHRARARLARDDREGAREELEAALAVCPGVREDEAPLAPRIEGGTALHNAQNHLAYLALAELLPADEPRALELYEAALRRSRRLARAELGGTLAELAATTPEAARAEATRIVTTNLASPSLGGEGMDALGPPSPGTRLLASPVWETTDAPGEGGWVSVRRASLVPAAFAELYFEGPAEAGLRAHGAELAATLFAETREAPFALAWRLRAARHVWVHPFAPVTAPLPAPFHPASGLLSAILVAVARGFRAGGTPEQIAAHLRGEDAPSFTEALTRLEAWEGEQLSAAIASPA